MKNIKISHQTAPAIKTCYLYIHLIKLERHSFSQAVQGPSAVKLVHAVRVLPLLPNLPKQQYDDKNETLVTILQPLMVFHQNNIKTVQLQSF